MKPIRLSQHALRYTRKRGFTVAEVEDTIRTSAWMPTELGPHDCRKNFSYGNEWNAELYAIKQVRPIFVEEPREIVVITVYTYYFNQP